MGIQVVPIPLVIFFLVVCCNGIKGQTISNSSSVKTILTAYGDTYDCVDFYKQPAFDHPLLKNYTFDYKMMATPFPNTIFQESTNAGNLVSIELEGEGCPIGTVPIRRDTKVDFSKEKVANGGYYSAGARTPSTSRYTGAGAYISVHNPNVAGKQYSSARVKIQNGPESIEAGLRVDPTLYGDSKTRVYVHTYAGQRGCFGLCGGFILLNHYTILDKPVPNISKPEGPYIVLPLFIHRDEQGNWNLYLGNQHLKVGFWPSQLFMGLKDVASYIEWGGEVYDPNPTPTAQMGAGKIVDHDHGFKNACFRQTSEYNGAGDQPIDANDLEAFSDSVFYSSTEKYYHQDTIRRRVLYGGPN